MHFLKIIFRHSLFMSVFSRKFSAGPDVISSAGPDVMFSGGPDRMFSVGPDATQLVPAELKILCSSFPFLFDFITGCIPFFSQKGANFCLNFVKRRCVYQIEWRSVSSRQTCFTTFFERRHFYKFSKCY